MLQTETIPVQIPMGCAQLYESTSQEERQKIAWVISAALKEIFPDTKTNQNQVLSYSDDEFDDEELKAWSRLAMSVMAKKMEDEPDIYTIDDIKDLHPKS